MTFQVDIFDKNTCELIQSITGCRTHREALEVAGSFRDDTRTMVIRECSYSDERRQQMNDQLFELYLADNPPTYKLLKSGKHLGFDYVIVWFRDHPNAYVRIPRNHPYFEKDYNEISSKEPVNGGFTFSGELNREYGVKNGWYIGWDYAHLNDFRSGSYINDGRRWSIEDITEECKKAIEEVFVK